MFDDGRYTALAQIGSGGIATVWSVLDNKLETEKAIKVLTLTNSQILSGSHQEHTDSGVKRFIREAKLMSRINHPNILTVHDYFATEQNLFIVMEKCLGSLDGWVESNGPMPMGLTIKVMIEALNGLEYAHAREITHRDIKPHNILISESGAIKLGDFGLAHDTYASDIYTKTNALMGSIQFMSPEQRVDAKRVDGSSDLYSLAMTMVWLLEGRTVGDLFVAEVIEELRSRYPEDLVNIIEKAGRRSPENRFSTAGDMGTALRGLNLNVECDESLLFGLPVRETPIQPKQLEAMTTIGSQTNASIEAEVTKTAENLNRLSYLMVGVLIILLGIGSILAYERLGQDKTSNFTTVPITQSEPVQKIEQCSYQITSTQTSLVMGPRESYNMVMNDFNGDGNHDAAFANLMDKSFSVYFGDGKSPIDTLQAIEVKSVRSFAAPLFGDVNKDGMVDMVGLHSDASTITVHKGLSRTSFRGLEMYGRDEMLQEPAPISGALTDYDQDGWLDLLFMVKDGHGYALVSRLNATKGLDYEILDLPGVEEEPFRWHKILARFPNKFVLTPSKAIVNYIKDNTLTTQTIQQNGMLGPKTIISDNVADLSIMQVVETMSGTIWILRGKNNQIVMLKEGQDPCELMENLKQVGQMSERGHASFGDWNKDGKLDILTSASCTYCTSNHILHITQ